jgi:type III secretion protein C
MTDFSPPQMQPGSPRCGARRRAIFCGLLCASLMVPLLALAADIPWRHQRLDLQANNEPLNQFLNRVLSPSAIPVTMSPLIASAKVNGRLQGPDDMVFKELMSTYGLSWYHDGSMLYLYSRSELESRMLQVAPADVHRIQKTLQEMRLFDGRFPLRIARSEGKVLVSGPPHYVNLVSSVAERIAQSPSSPTPAILAAHSVLPHPSSMDTRVFKLRHARAADTVVNIAGVETTIPGTARILSETLGLGTGVAPSPAPPRTLPSTVPGLRGQGQLTGGHRSGGDQPPGKQAGPAPLPSVPAQSDTASPHPPMPSNSSAFPASNETVMVRADPRTNAVIVRDFPERMPMVARLIGELDIATPLLEIEATVIDVSYDKSEQLGIDWRAHGRRADVVSSPNGLAGNGLGAPNSAGDLLYNLPARSTGTGLVGTLLFGSERNNFLARLNALTQNGDANLISKPRVLTLDNTEAVLQSTRDFYVRVAGRDEVDLFNVSLGLVLRVTPTLIEESVGGKPSNKIKLNIRIEDGNTSGGGQVDQIPIVNRNAIATQAVVGDGHSLLVGGYTIDEKSRSSAGVPVLSGLPGLRWLFGQKTQSAKRIERIFMITPRLVKATDANHSASSSVLPASVLAVPALSWAPPLPASAPAPEGPALVRAEH